MSALHRASSRKADVSLPPERQQQQPARRKGSHKVRPVLNASVASSLFGESGRHATLKQQLRSARRLLQRSASLPADVRSRKEAEVKILTDQLAEKQKRDRDAAHRRQVQDGQVHRSDCSSRPDSPRSLQPERADSLNRAPAVAAWLPVRAAEGGAALAFPASRSVSADDDVSLCQRGGAAPQGRRGLCPARPGLHRLLPQRHQVHRALPLAAPATADAAERAARRRRGRGRGRGRGGRAGGGMAAQAQREGEDGVAASGAEAEPRCSERGEGGEGGEGAYSAAASRRQRCGGGGEARCDQGGGAASEAEGDSGRREGSAARAGGRHQEGQEDAGVQGRLLRAGRRRQQGRRPAAARAAFAASRAAGQRRQQTRRAEAEAADHPAAAGEAES